MKKLFTLTLLCTVISFCFLSCSKNDEVSTLSEAQKKAIAVLNGKFVYTFYTIKTSYTFVKQYICPFGYTLH